MAYSAYCRRCRQRRKVNTNGGGCEECENIELAFFCDIKRHLICEPYSVVNLHWMAKIFGISKHWYHAGNKFQHPHYDIPKKRVAEIMAKCTVITQRELLEKIKRALNGK